MAIYIDPCFFLFGAVLVLTLPLRWLFCAVFSAVFHELCHLAGVVLFGGRIRKIGIGISGARIEADLPDRPRELAAILLGPAGSLLLLFLAPWMPEAAVCGFVQGIFNLLPVRPLDGGRTLRIVLDMWCPAFAEMAMEVVETGILGLLLVGAVYGALEYCLGWWPVLGVILLLLGSVPRKIPCKRSQFGVQ